MDVYVPIQGQSTSNAALEALDDLLTDLLARATLELWLYKNNVVPSPNVVIGDFLEANFGGYVRKTIAAFDGPFLDVVKNAYATTDLQAYTCDGTAGNTVYGSLLVATPPGATAATATNAGDGAGNYNVAFVVTAGGGGYQSAPKVTLTGATGSGATAHAVITAGVVTSIVLDNPGDGAYTTFTVVIDPPLEVVVQSVLSQTGIPMALATDAILTLAQLTVPANLAA